MSTALRSRISKLEAQGASNGRVDGVVLIKRGDGTLIQQFGSQGDRGQQPMLIVTIAKDGATDGEANFAQAHAREGMH